MVTVSEKINSVFLQIFDLVHFFPEAFNARKGWKTKRFLQIVEICVIQSGSENQNSPVFS